MEESTLQSQENSPKEPQEILLKLPSKNNAILDCNNAVGDGNMLAYCQISEMSSRTLQNDLLQEGKLPPMQNQPRKWGSQPSTTTPFNSTQPPAETALKMKIEAWHQFWMCGMIYQASPKSSSMVRKGIPKQENLSAKQHQQS